MTSTGKIAGEAEDILDGDGNSESITTVDTISNTYRRYALFILFCTYSLSFLDRQIINILAEPIKHDLHLQDWQIGALSGLAFALLYTFAGIPIARFAERTNRPRVIGTSLFIWSGFTALCGMAQNFWQLAAIRVGLGLGEAGGTPAAHALITDYSPPEKRASGMSMFHAGSSFGSLLGLILGGVIADLYGWRAAFIIVGVPGLLLAVLVFLLPEPRKSSGKRTNAPFQASLKELFSKRSYVLLIFGTGFIAFTSFGQAAFLPSFFFRNHAQDLASVAQSANALFGTHLGVTAVLGIVLGLTMGVSGIIGTLVGGSVTDRLSQTRRDATPTVIALAGFVGGPMFLGVLWVPGFWAAMTILFVQHAIQSMTNGVVYAGIQSLARPQIRPTASAVVLFLVNLIGLGGGPVIIGLQSDMLASWGLAGGPALRLSLVTPVVFALLSAGLFWLSRRSYAAELWVEPRHTGVAGQAAGEARAP